jgi:hypothetical protein
MEVTSELETTLAVKNGVFWVVTPCGSCKNRRFGGNYYIHHQGAKSRGGMGSDTTNYQLNQDVKKY